MRHADEYRLCLDDCILSRRKIGRDLLATNLGYGYMPVKVESCVMDIIQTLSLGINMEHYSFPRFREKDPFVTDFYNGVKGGSESASTTEDEDAGSKMWLPTPPLSPPHGNESLLPEMEMSDLDQLQDELARLSKQQGDMFYDDAACKSSSRFNTDFNHHHHNERGDGFHLLDNLFDDEGDDPLQKMLIDPSIDRMWSGNDQAKKPSSWCPILSTLDDEQQLFPDLPSSWGNQSMSILGSMTPSDSDSEEIDVVSTEEEKKQSSPFDPVYVSMLAKAKREASVRRHASSSKNSWSSSAQSKKSHALTRVFNIATCSPSSSPTFHHNYSLSPDSAIQEPKKVRLVSGPRASPEPSMWHDYAEKDCFSSHSASDVSTTGASLRNSMSHRCASSSKSTTTQKSTLRQKVGRSQNDRVSKHSRLVSRRSAGSNDYSALKNDGERRQQHNVLERNRRNYMKSLYEDLRVQVPILLHKEKTSKVGILDGSKTFIFSLQDDERKLEMEKNKLKVQNQALERRILYLKSI